MESLFALVDAYFVSQVSSRAMATVGLTETVITLVYAIAIGISTAPVAIISRYIGQKDEAGAAKAAKQAIYLAILVSAVIGIPGVIWAESILRIMGGSEELIATGVNYTRIMFGSNVVIMLLFLLNGIFRGAGDAAYAMRALWIANGINIILDPLFIFGIGPFPELGVAGAAVATTIGRGIGVGYQLYILFGGRATVKLRAGNWRINWEMLTRLGKIASNGAFQYIIASASWIFLMRIAAQFGDEVVAGYTISIRLIIFALLPAWGLSNAAATLVGQNLGAQKPDRAIRSVKITAWFAGGFLGLVSIVYLLFTSTLIQFFDSSPVVLEAGVTSLRIFALGYTFYGFGMIFYQAFNGAGDTRTPMWINVFCFWLLEIPLGYFLGLELNWGIAGVSWAAVTAECALTIISFILFRRGKWLLTKV